MMSFLLARLTDVFPWIPTAKEEKNIFNRMLREIDQLQVDLQKVLKYSVGDSVGDGPIDQFNYNS